MKHKNVIKYLVLASAIVLASCSNKIPDKKISVELSPEEITDATEIDSTFDSLYTEIRSTFYFMNKVKQAYYHDITYREIYDYINYLKDTNYWNPLFKKWESEWNTENTKKLQKADSIIQYWKKYKEDNALENYVSISLERVKTNYSYGYLDNVNFGFRITPLKGKIEQLRFSYSLKPKILEDDDYFETHGCILTSPVSTPSLLYWEADYSDEKKFEGMSAEQILRDYDLKIEIKKVRYDGRNIDEESLGIPESVDFYLKHYDNDTNDFSELSDIFKGDIVKDFVDKNFKNRHEYIEEKATEICEKKNKKCFLFVKEMSSRKFEESPL